MTWQDTLIELFNAAFPISRAMAVHKLTATEAWTSPDARVPREKLLSFLNRAGVAAALAEAERALVAMHAALAAKDPLTAQDLIKLGVLSASAPLLSNQTLAQLEQPEALFSYIMEKLLPWLQRLAQVEVIAVAWAIAPSGPAPQLPSARAIHPTGDLVSRDLGDEVALLGELVATTRMLTEILYRRSQTASSLPL